LGGLVEIIDEEAQPPRIELRVPKTKGLLGLALTENYDAVPDARVQPIDLNLLLDGPAYDRPRINPEREFL
jgi:hypothetical protein